MGISLERCIKYLRFIRLDLIKRMDKKRQKELAALKGRHRGDRCFVIGNGPSLTKEDVEKLQGEITFACNKIFTLGENCVPTYYFMHDPVLLPENFAEAKKLQTTKFWGMHKNTERFLRKADVREDYVYYIRKNSLKKEIAVSEDVSRYVTSSGSVAYAMLQFAFYMGFEEIYLLGFDHNFSKIEVNGKEIVNENVTDHFASYNDVVTGAVNVDKLTRGFMEAKQYADTHGVRIFNATRGGKLDVFERVDLDEILLRIHQDRCVTKGVESK